MAGGRDLVWSLARQIHALDLDDEPPWWRSPTWVSSGNSLDLLLGSRSGRRTDAAEISAAEHKGKGSEGPHGSDEWRLVRGAVQDLCRICAEVRKPAESLPLSAVSATGCKSVLMMSVAGRGDRPDAVRNDPQSSHVSPVRAAWRFHPITLVAAQRLGRGRRRVKGHWFLPGGGRGTCPVTVTRSAR